MTPYQAVYGREPPPLPCYLGLNSGIPAVDKVLLDRSELLQRLKLNLQQAQNRMKQQTDKKRMDIEFQVGDYVLVKLQPYRQVSVARRSSQKLSKRFFGPFEIMERYGPVAYKLALPDTSKIHPVFHVSLLKRWKGPLPTVITELPPVTASDHPILEPKAILDAREVLIRGKRERQVLVQWHNNPEEDTSWEKFDDLKTLCPFLMDLEDKVFVGGEGIDMNGGNNVKFEFPIVINCIRNNVAREAESSNAGQKCEKNYDKGDDVEKELRRGARVRQRPGQFRDFVMQA